MAAKDSFAGKLAYTMMAGDDLLQFVAKEAKGHLKARVDAVVELYTDQALRYVQSDVALWGVEKMSYYIKRGLNGKIDKLGGGSSLLEVSSFTHSVSYMEVGEHVYQTYHRIDDPLTRARYLEALCRELNEKGNGALNNQCKKLDFSWLDETQAALYSHDVSFLQKRAHLQKKKKKSIGKKLAKAFVSSAVGKFKTSFAKIGGKIGKFVQKASDFLSSNDNVIGRLLNKVRALKNVVVQKAFKVLDKAESFANKFISRFPAPIRLKLEEAMHKPLNDIRGKISQADSRLDNFLKPIETQFEKLKDKYVPDYARELMQLDNIPSEDLSSGDLTGVSQEYLDQAKGTIEAELDQKATAHVNDNIQTIDNELADAEKTKQSGRRFKWCWRGM